MTRIASTWRPGDWDATPPSAAPPVVVTGPHAPSPKRRGRWRTVLVASLALHALAIAIITLAVRQERMTDLDALPALDISLAEGPRAPAASPTPTLQSSPGPPSTSREELAPGGATPAPPPNAAVPPPPPALLSEAPSQAATAAPPQTGPVAPEAPAFAALTPAPNPPQAATTPASPTPPEELPLPVPPVPPPAPPPVQTALARPPALPVPLTPRPAPTPTRPLQEAPHERPSPPRSREAQRVDPRSGFPMPMNLSLGKALAQLGTGFGHAPEHEQDGQVPRGARSLGGADTSTDLSGDNLGPEWASLLRAWVDRHKYYPPEAAENGEDGTSTVRVIIRRDGEVQSVMLTGRSGSVFLDMATQGLFRQQRLPPFPASWNEPTATIYFTMHYILIR